MGSACEGASYLRIRPLNLVRFQVSIGFPFVPATPGSPHFGTR
jgi:hypothetical protein